MAERIKEAKARANLYFNSFCYTTLFSQFPDWVSGMTTLEDIQLLALSQWERQEMAPSPFNGERLNWTALHSSSTALGRGCLKQKCRESIITAVSVEDMLLI